jgi:hypothetical protein
MSYQDDPRHEDPQEIAFNTWHEAFEDKLMDHFRCDHQIQRELRAAFHSGDDPGLRAAWFIETYLLGQRELMRQTRVATDSALGAKFEAHAQDGMEFDELAP